MTSLSPADRALGDVLLARRILTIPQLDEAVRLAETWKVRLSDAILSRNWIQPERLYEGLAYYYDLPFVDLVAEAPDPAVLVAAEADGYLQRLIVPWRRHNGRLLVATAERARELLAWKPQYTNLHRIVETAWNWHSRHPEGYSG